MTEEEMILEMNRRAHEAGVIPNANLPKIARARIRMKLDISTCPCDPKSDRGCISARCLREIKENGICHCSCYLRKDD